MKTSSSTISDQNEAGSPSLSPVATDPITIAKGPEVKGEIIGCESLYIDGKVMGTIYLPGSRVTVGRDGQVSADICAREVVVLGAVHGNVDASDRVNISSEGSLIGDVITQRVSIAEGTFFKAFIDIQRPGQVNDGMATPGQTDPELQKMALMACRTKPASYV
jgi:cytoskeletal protein CcmA (bactofilin family)